MIPFADLRAQYHSIKPEIDQAVLSVLESAHYVLGEQVNAFESEFASYCGTSEAIGVNSGTSALHLALLAAGIGRGRRGDHGPFHIRCDRGGDPLHRRHAGLCRY